MNCSDIKRHIIVRKYYFGYIIVIFVSVLLGYSVFTGEESISIFILRGMYFALAIICFSAILIGYIVINIYRCRSFYKFYNSFLRGYGAQFNRVFIEKESYKMSVPYKSYDAIIQPSPKPTNTVFLETNDFILLFFSIRYLSVFQLILKPFIFVKPDKEFCIKDKSVNIIRDFKITEAKEDRTIIFTNKDGIKKLIIPTIFEPTI